MNMKKMLPLLFCCFASIVFGQKNIHTTDIGHFWQAYDSIQIAKTDKEKLAIINRFYINQASIGLKAFMQARDYNDSLYVKLIAQYPKFWNSIRSNTLQIKSKARDLQNAVDHLKKLYPDLKPAEIYFTIGGLRSGGTVDGNMVLIGAEIATGDSHTNVSELEGNWLKNVFAKQSIDNIVKLNIHEYIHTQQIGAAKRLLDKSIAEGSCDFIAELATQNPMLTAYISYGIKHADSLKQRFKNQMFSTQLSDWLYNGAERNKVPDLGYYMGYEISKSYYQQAKNRAKAIKDIIELNYDSEEAVESFLLKSKFFKEGFDKKQLVEAFEKNMPTIIAFDPVLDEKAIDPNLKELRVIFSKEMMTDRYSINLSDRGKAFFPITKIKGWENENKTLILELALEPRHEYEFEISNRSFKSKDGYQLRRSSYPVKFTTH